MEPPVAIPPQLCPGGDRPIHRLRVPPFIHEYEIIGNQRYTGHSWRHNEPRPFVNECALVYARAITTCPRGREEGGTIVAGGADGGTRGTGNEGEDLEESRDISCVLSQLNPVSLLSGLIFMSVYRGNRCLNERRCP